MKEAWKFLLFSVGILIAANAIAWALSSVLPPHDGNVLIIAGALGMVACFSFIWLVKNALSRLVWFATMSYVSFSVGIDAHLAFNKAFGQSFALKTFFTAVLVAFLITAVLRKNYNENPGT